jgi:uncharacterized protein (DUF1810 family)
MPAERGGPAPQDPYDLQRFIAAQEPVFARVLAELQAGYKQSHWMWFIFPQMAGLGRSATARYYAIRSWEEAAAFLAHPLLGSRLEQCAGEVEAVEGRSAREIFGSIDALKLHSSMTLFASVADKPIFSRIISKYFDGRPDPATLELLARAAGE